MDSTTPERPDGGALDHWKANAEAWKSNEARIRTMTAEVTARLLAALDPAPGQRILDVAAGIGNPSLDIATRVGAAGRVVATDGVLAMLDDLHRRARERGAAHVEVVLSPAESLPFDDDSFDGACSRFGVMFFTDPAAGLKHMARCVRAYGRLVVTCWGDPARTPYFTLVNGALDDVGAPEVPKASCVFEFGQRGHLAALAGQSGWRHVHEEVVSFAMTLPQTTPAGLLDAQARLSRSIRLRAEQTPTATLDRARALVAERAAVHARGPDIVLPAEAYVVAGRV